MQQYKTNIIFPDYIQKAYSENLIAFDIETTGLNKKYHMIYMIGFLRKEGESFTLYQYLATSEAEEKEILIAFLDALSPNTTLLTFNGARFDIPFIETRAAHHGVDISFKEYAHRDLFLTAKNLKKLCGYPACNQKTIESFLGIHREDRYGGGELLSVFSEYQKNQKDTEARDLLLLHNFCDVEGLASLLVLNDFYQVRNLELSNVSTALTTHKTFDGKECPELSVTATTNISLPRDLHFQTEFCYIVLSNYKFNATIPLIAETLHYYLDDYKSYVYLREEDLCIPKELATNIPKERKEKATAETCCVKKEGLFYEVPSDLLRTEIYFKENKKDRKTYLLYEEENFSPAYLCDYIKSLI